MNEAKNNVPQPLSTVDRSKYRTNRNVKLIYFCKIFSCFFIQTVKPIVIKAGNLNLKKSRELRNSYISSPIIAFTKRSKVSAKSTDSVEKYILALIIKLFMIFKYL